MTKNAKKISQLLKLIIDKPKYNEQKLNKSMKKIVKKNIGSYYCKILS